MRVVTFFTSEHYHICIRWKGSKGLFQIGFSAALMKSKRFIDVTLRLSSRFFSPLYHRVTDMKETGKLLCHCGAETEFFIPL